MKILLRKSFMLGVFLLAACQASSTTEIPTNNEEHELTVMAVESFLADIAQQVAGERLEVETLVPPGVDPHTFQPTPQDVAKITNSQVLIVNGAGLEEWLGEVLENAGGERLVIEASQGLSSPPSRPGDPHFWLDPNYGVHYTEKIRDGFIEVDPDGNVVYAQNAAQYIGKLGELDAWIVDQVSQIPAEQRLLVTNHESFGYFADRYQFKVLGTILPSFSTGSSPSAQQLVQLIEAIRVTKTPAIFLESGTNPELAEQVAREAGVEVIENLLTHSTSTPGGYLEMLEYNTSAIVEALR
jgi:ABC-type Zn uptake system ZnuABC Zn-binding protein ZnuA